MTTLIATNLLSLNGLNKALKQVKAALDAKDPTDLYLIVAKVVEMILGRRRRRRTKGTDGEAEAKNLALINALIFELMSALGKSEHFALDETTMILMKDAQLCLAFVRLVVGKADIMIWGGGGKCRPGNMKFAQDGKSVTAKDRERVKILTTYILEFLRYTIELYLKAKARYTDIAEVRADHVSVKRAATEEMSDEDSDDDDSDDDFEEKPAKTPVKAVVPAEAPVEAPVEAVVPAEAPVEAVVPAEAPVEAVVPAEAPVEAVVPAEVEAVVPAKAPSVEENSLLPADVVDGLVDDVVNKEIASAAFVAAPAPPTRRSSLAAKDENAGPSVAPSKLVDGAMSAMRRAFGLRDGNAM